MSDNAAPVPSSPRVLAWISAACISVSLLIMIGASGLSYDEAAKICGCPTGTIKSRVNRARTELAHLLSIEGPEDFEEDRVIAAVIASGDRAAMRAS